MMLKKILDYFKKLAYQEKSSHKLALSFCMGTYRAFSPFPGLHTIMIFVFSILFGLNMTVTFAAAYGINNPFTLVPVYAADYGVGYWLLYKIAAFDASAFNPWWINSLSTVCEQRLGFPLPCMWSFLIGGNILGIVLACLLYPITKQIFTYCKASESGTLL